MTVLVPNASEAERQRLPGGGARVALSWDPEHMHLVRESPAPKRSPTRKATESAEAQSLKRRREGEEHEEQRNAARRGVG